MRRDRRGRMPGADLREGLSVGDGDLLCWIGLADGLRNLTALMDIAAGNLQKVCGGQSRCWDMLLDCLVVAAHSSPFFTGITLHNLVFNFIEHFLALAVLLVADIRTNAEQKSFLQLRAPVPSPELVSNLVQAHFQCPGHDCQSFADCRHHFVLDAVVDHFAVVSSNAKSDAVDAG